MYTRDSLKYLKIGVFIVDAGNYPINVLHKIGYGIHIEQKNEMKL